MCRCDIGGLCALEEKPNLSINSPVTVNRRAWGTGNCPDAAFIVYETRLVEMLELPIQ